MRTIAYILPALVFLTLLATLPLRAVPLPPETGEDLKLLKVMHAPAGPNSITYSGRGLFVVTQKGEEYRMSVWDRRFAELGQVSARVRFSDYNELGYTGWHVGAPVFATMDPDGKHAYVVNRSMAGAGFASAGNLPCDPGQNADPSYLFRLDLQRLEVDRVSRVGSQPRHAVATPDGKLVLVTNWCSGDLSVVDTELGVEIKRVALSEHPLGLAVDQKSRYAYVTVSSEGRLAVVRLADFSLRWINGLGAAPTQVCTGPSGRYLYLILGQEGAIAKFDLVKETIVSRLSLGKQPHQMILSPDGAYLYSIDFQGATLSKIATQSLQLIQTVPTRQRPQGIAFDPVTHQIWVACASGSIMVFEDQRYVNPSHQAEVLEERIAQQAPHPAPSLTQVPGMPSSQSSSLYYLQRERSLTQPSEEASSSDEATPVLHYYVVVGSYGEEKNARERAIALKAQGYPSAVVPGDKGLFRVCSHQFSTRREALGMLDQIKQDLQPQAWILAAPGQAMQ